MPFLSSRDSTRRARTDIRTTSRKPYSKPPTVAAAPQVPTTQFVYIDENKLSFPNTTSYTLPVIPLGLSSYPRRSSPSSLARPPPPDVPGLLTYAQYKALENRWIENMNPRKRARCLIDQKTFDLIWDVLLSPEDLGLAISQTRYWIRRAFSFDHPQTSFSRPHINATYASAYEDKGILQPVVMHDNLPLAVQEYLYQILCACHIECDHGGRDRTCKVVRDNWSWVPKELVALFVRNCPTCLVKRTGLRIGEVGGEKEFVGVLVESQRRVGEAREKEKKEREAIESVVRVLGEAMEIEMYGEGEGEVTRMPMRELSEVGTNAKGSLVSGYTAPEMDLKVDVLAWSGAQTAQRPRSQCLVFPPSAALARSVQPGDYQDLVRQPGVQGWTAAAPSLIAGDYAFSGDMARAAGVLGSSTENCEPTSQSISHPPSHTDSTIVNNEQNTQLPAIPAHAGSGSDILMFLNEDAFSPVYPNPHIPSALPAFPMDPVRLSIQYSNPMTLEQLLNPSASCVNTGLSLDPNPSQPPAQVDTLGYSSTLAQEDIALPPLWSALASIINDAPALPALQVPMDDMTLENILQMEDHPIEHPPTTAAHKLSYTNSEASLFGDRYADDGEEGLISGSSPARAQPFDPSRDLPLFISSSSDDEVLHTFGTQWTFDDNGDSDLFGGFDRDGQFTMTAYESVQDGWLGESGPFMEHLRPDEPAWIEAMSVLGGRASTLR